MRQITGKTGMRKIIHIDMDAFFASVEQRDNEALRGKPVAVGFDGPRGVISTASYEARRYGVHSAMAVSTAKRLCPSLVIVPCRMNVYKEVSAIVRQVFAEYTDVIEPISIDEAFLDVTDFDCGDRSVEDIAVEIKRKIKERTSLTSSAGVSFNKFLAKIASDYRKPDGLFVIPPESAQEFIDTLPVSKFWGIGTKTEEMMHKMGVFVGGQLRAVPLQHLTEVFGKSGEIYYNFSRGKDDRPVVSTWERKSVGCERTFLEDISIKSTVIIELYHAVLELEERIRKAGFRGKTLTLKVKFCDFRQITRSVTSTTVLTCKDEILPLAKQLMSGVEYSCHPIRLMGLNVSNPIGSEIPSWREGWLFKHDEM